MMPIRARRSESVDVYFGFYSSIDRMQISVEEVWSMTRVQATNDQSRYICISKLNLGRLQATRNGVVRIRSLLNRRS
jgi:hypothetical protein